MPGGSKYEGPVESLDLYRFAVEQSSAEKVKGAKNPYTSRNGHMFSFLDADGSAALRLSTDLETEFRSQFASGPVEQYGRTMQGYSAVPADLLSNSAEFATWVSLSWDWIGSLKPKSTKAKPNKKT